VQEFLLQQTRFKMLAKSKPDDADRLWKLAQKDVDNRFHMYEYMASRKPQGAAPANGHQRTTEEAPATDKEKRVPVGGR